MGPSDAELHNSLVPKNIVVKERGGRISKPAKSLARMEFDHPYKARWHPCVSNCIIQSPRSCRKSQSFDAISIVSIDSLATTSRWPLALAREKKNGVMLVGT